MREDPKLVWRKTLIHIDKGKAYGRQGKAPTGLIFAEARLLTAYVSNARGWPLGWQMSGPPGSAKFATPGTDKADKCPAGGGGEWAQLELTDALLTAKPSF